MVLRRLLGFEAVLAVRISVSRAVSFLCTISFFFFYRGRSAAGTVVVVLLLFVVPFFIVRTAVLVDRSSCSTKSRENPPRARPWDGEVDEGRPKEDVFFVCVCVLRAEICSTGVLLS